MTEHGTLEGKLHVCAIKDVSSNRIVGYPINSRIKSRVAVNALNNAAVRRADVAGCIVHTDRESQFRSRKHIRALNHHCMVGPWAASVLPAIIPPWSPSSLCCTTTSWTAASELPARNYASRSLPGSKGPITDAVGKDASAD